MAQAGTGAATPTLFDTVLFRAFEQMNVAEQLCNTDYQGKLTMGESIWVKRPGRVASSDWTPGKTLTATKPVMGNIEIPVDWAKDVVTEIEDLAEVQSDVSLVTTYGSDAGVEFSEQMDTEIFSRMDSGVASDNKLSQVTNVGTASGNTSAYYLLTQLDRKLTEAHVPRSGRWAVIPPWFEVLLRNDGKIVDHGTTANRRDLAGNETVGNLSGFNLYVSTNLPTKQSTGNSIIGGVDSAVTVVKQMNKSVNREPHNKLVMWLISVLVAAIKVMDSSRLVSVSAKPV